MITTVTSDVQESRNTRPEFVPVMIPTRAQSELSLLVTLVRTLTCPFVGMTEFLIKMPVKPDAKECPLSIRANVSAITIPN